MGVEKVEMDELMEREDLIKIKKKIIEKKRNIINEKKMEKMKKGVRIVNWERGGMIVEKDMIEEMK